jgi:hypothetical protein
MIFIRHRKSQKKEKEVNMEYFSTEYKDKLLNEHKLVTTTISRLTQRYPLYAANHTGEAISLALTNLRGRKVELEGMIDVLDEFLN